jgi:hypothetical protein
MEEIERMRVLYEDQKLAASVVGDMVGVTRNVVIGYAHRRGWRGGWMRPKPVKAVAPRKPGRAAALRKPKQPPRPPTLPAHAPTSRREEAHTPPLGAPLLAFLDLGRDCCHFPFDQPDGRRLFCGKPVIENKPWCPDCYRIVYTTPEQRTEARREYERQKRSGM